MRARAGSSENQAIAGGRFYMAETIAAAKPAHLVSIDNRSKIVISGINEVTSYDSNTIVASSEAGELILQGQKLHINSFDQTSGRLSADGKIDAVQYVDLKPKNESFFSRLLK